MRSVRAALAATVLCLIAHTTMLAQGAQTAAVPRVINLTGVFQPVDGQPPRAVETVTLAIYAEPTGGTPLWQETQSVAVDTKGRYALLLGATAPDGIPAAVLAAGAQWLGTKFDRPGEVEGPRLQLTSVPYTLRAADADTLGGRPASAYLLAPTTSAGEGHAANTTASAGAGQMTATASGLQPPTPAPADVQPGTVNFLAKYVTGADVGNSAVFENAGRVGIGTTAPVDSLHVNFTNTNGALTGLAVQNLGNTATSYSGMLFYDQNGATAQFQGFNNVTHEYRINNIAQNGAAQFNGSINFMVGSTSRFLVTSAGNIGIGTTSPGAVLDVSNALIPALGNANIAATSYGANSFGSEIFGRKARGTAAAPSAVLNNDALAIWGGKGYGATGFSTISSGISVHAAENWTDTAQGTLMNFTTTPTGTTQPAVRMTVSPNGNVGIGVFGPQAGLEVSNANNASGAGMIYATTFTNAGTSLFVGRRARGTGIAPTAVLNGDNLVGYQAQGYGTSGFSFIRGGMFVAAAENWTDAAQGTKLNFTTTATGSTTGGTRMTIDSSGNVGIGTPAPNGLLELAKTGTANLFASSFGSGQGSGFKGRAARGTFVAPTATLFGDELAEFTAAGYGTTGFNETAGWAAFATENWTDTAQGTAMALFATPVGSNQAQPYMAILANGNIGISTPLDIDGFPTATDKLQMFGDARVGNAGTNGCLKNFAGTGIAGTCASDRRFKKNITPFSPRSIGSPRCNQFTTTGARRNFPSAISATRRRTDSSRRTSNKSSPSSSSPATTATRRSITASCRC